MNVRDLIDLLSKYPPYMPVKVLCGEIYGAYDDTGVFRGDMPINITAEDATEANDVRNEGNFILVRTV